jgi:hypothetical protein
LRLRLGGDGVGQVEQVAGAGRDGGGGVARLVAAGGDVAGFNQGFQSRAGQSGQCVGEEAV